MSKIFYSKNNWISFSILIAITIFLLQSFPDFTFTFREFNYLSQPYDFRGIAKGGIFFFGYFISILGILFLTFTKSRKIFFLFISLSFLTYYFDLLAQLFGSYRGMSVEELAIAISQYRLVGNMQSYWSEIFIAIIGSLIFCLILYLARIKTKKRFNNFLGFIFFLLSNIIVFKSAENIYSVLTNAYPAPVKAMPIVLQYFDSWGKLNTRSIPQNVQAPNLSGEKNLIWIIDESATGSYLSVNGYAKQTTPRLEQIFANDSSAYNFGIVNSTSNCSNFSNLFLRIGASPQHSLDYENLIDHGPSIFQLAKKAGYATLLFDAQITKGEKPNFLHPQEYSFIDQEFTLSRDVLPMDRDESMKQLLIEHLNANSEKPSFIIFLKFGCHFPYPLNYQGKETYFHPAQVSTATRMKISNRVLVENAYLNSVRHNVDNFLADLYPLFDYNQSVVFYTSDHGQSILEKETVRTHCTNNIRNLSKKEFDVPLFVFGKINERFNESSIDSLNYSQIQMFPTTLYLMGYDTSFVKNYGPGLFETNSVSKRSSYVTGTGKIFDFD